MGGVAAVKCFRAIISRGLWSVSMVKEQLHRCKWRYSQVKIMASNSCSVLVYHVLASFRELEVKAIGLLCYNKWAPRLCLVISVWTVMGRSLQEYCKGVLCALEMKDVNFWNVVLVFSSKEKT